MFDKAVKAFLLALTFVPDWLLRLGWLRNFIIIYSHMVTYYFFDEDSSNVIFPSDEMGILRIDLNNINFDDNNFYQDDPEFIVHVRVMA